MCIYLCMHKYIYEHICIETQDLCIQCDYVCTHVKYVFTHVYMYVCLFVCIMYVCIYYM